MARAPVPPTCRGLCVCVCIEGPVVMATDMQAHAAHKHTHRHAKSEAVHGLWNFLQNMMPTVGLEPTTTRLRVLRSAN